jgi:hypothetical protein
MFISERREPLFSFASLPESVKAGPEDDLVLRPFGLYESDLNVNFNQARRPFLVTRILDCCTRDAGEGRVKPEFFWNLTVGKRIECLLNLLRGGAESEIPLTFLCPNQECGEELEIEISVREITALQAQAYETQAVCVTLELGSLVLRRPTGIDQVAWLKSSFASQDAAIEAMVRTLLLPLAGAVEFERSAIPSEIVQVVEQALDEFDPLVNFRQPVKCFSCGTENLIELDLEKFSLERLRQAQLRLLASVHKLAAHYHWSEQEIFSVPYWRRTRYLSFIEKEKNR